MIYLSFSQMLCILCRKAILCVCDFLVLLTRISWPLDVDLCSSLPSLIHSKSPSRGSCCAPLVSPSFGETRPFVLFWTCPFISPCLFVSPSSPAVVEAILRRSCVDSIKTLPLLVRFWSLSGSIVVDPSVLKLIFYLFSSYFSILSSFGRWPRRTRGRAASSSTIRRRWWVIPPFLVPLLWIHWSSLCWRGDLITCCCSPPFFRSSHSIYLLLDSVCFDLRLARHISR